MILKKKGRVKKNNNPFKNQIEFSRSRFTTGPAFLKEQKEAKKHGKGYSVR